MNYLRKLIGSFFYHKDLKWNKLSKGARQLIRKVILNKWYRPFNDNLQKVKKIRVSTYSKLF